MTAMTRDIRPNDLHALRSWAVEAVLNLRSFDATLLICLVALLMLGYVAMGSASIEFADTRYGNAFHHMTRHGVYLVIALSLGLVTFQLPMP